MLYVLRKFAKLLTDYCTKVKKLDEVLITSSFEAYPLIRELWRSVIERGAYPRLRLSDDVLTEIFYRYAPEELLKYLSEIDEYVAERVNVSITVVAPTHTKALVGIDPERIKVRSRALRKLTDIFMMRDSEGSLRWVVTAYPSRALAQEAGMSPIEFEDFVYRALKLYVDDPLNAWTKQAAMQERIASFLDRVSELRIVGEDTDIRMNVSGRKWINDDGRNNMPGGEVFSAPHEDSVEGYITFTYPAIWRGVEVEGVKLYFKKGVVVEAHALKGEEFLKKMLETDDGARKVGEVAFGLNYDIKRFTKQILFDEKIGGTIHLALGAAYPKTGGKNSSSIHWDMVKDMRKGKVFADGELVYVDGRFIEDVIV
ncbi:MAG: aminopeptidase [Desulfurococcales archaeon ex4484_204]|nr:MAG: aminopeptidase [Desulfurococcales archaeon ex4484_204]